MVSGKTIKIIYNEKTYTLKKQNNNYYLNDVKINTLSLEDIQDAQTAGIQNDNTNFEKYESFILNHYSTQEALLIVNLRVKLVDEFDFMNELIEELMLLLHNNDIHIINDMNFSFEINNNTRTLTYQDKFVTFPILGTWNFKEKILELLS